MKKYILLLGGIIFFSNLNAQVSPNQLGHGFILTKAKTLDKVEGSPYLEESFRRGSVIFEEKDPLEAFLRYNVLDEEMEIKMDKNSSEIYKLPTTGKTTFRIGNDLFVREEINYDGENINGFFKELYDGEKVRLLVKPEASISEAVVATSSYESDKPAEINIKENYYLIFEDGRTENVRLRKRDLRKAFDSKEVRGYLSDNKIRNVQDLISVAAFYDAQTQ